MMMMTRSLFVALLLVACTPLKEKPCKDMLLRPEAWTGSTTITCHHPLHEMRLEGDRWTCRCPKEPDAFDY